LQQSKQQLAMSKRWRNLLLTLSAGSVIFAGCKPGSMSHDNPIPESYHPSVVLSSDNQVVYAIDPATGKKNWEYSLPQITTSPAVEFAPSPLIYHDMVYMASVNSDTIYKLNAKTGILIAKLVTNPYYNFTMQSTPIADGALLYLATTNGTVYAIDTGTGLVKWQFSCPTDLTPYIASPVIYKNNIFVASTGGHVYCIDKVNGPDATTGYPIWDYPGWGLIDTAIFVSSPTISYPYLYVGSTLDSNMYCMYVDPWPDPVTPVTPTSGIQHWRFKTLGSIKSSPTSYAGMCIFGCNDFYVYAVDSQTGLMDWKFRTSSQVNSSPIIDNQVVYIGSYDYNLYALNIINGGMKWKFATKGLIKSSPLPYKGNIYVGSYDGYIYEVDSATGVQKWNFKINGNIQCSPAIDDYSGTQINSGISGYNTRGTNN
jgi:eukaryotic-like serine/threonine-protein kinase